MAPDGAREQARFDAYAPGEIAERVRDVGVRKANLDLPSMLVLSVLAGAFIGLGACLSTLSIAGFDGAYGLRRLVAGFSFSLGLILVILAGACFGARTTTDKILAIIFPITRPSWRSASSPRSRTCTSSRWDCCSLRSRRS